MVPLQVVSETWVNMTEKQREFVFDILFKQELTLSLMIQKAVQLKQTVENNPLVNDIVILRDAARKRCRELGYKGQF